MAGCNPAHTAIEERLRLNRHSMHYWRLVDSLHYLVHTRLDMAFAFGFMSRFVE
jgi:hypothetical protein